MLNVLHQPLRPCSPPGWPPQMAGRGPCPPPLLGCGRGTRWEFNPRDSCFSSVGVARWALEASLCGRCLGESWLSVLTEKWNMNTFQFESSMNHEYNTIKMLTYNISGIIFWELSFFPVLNSAKHNIIPPNKHTRTHTHTRAAFSAWVAK